ncbi:MAG: glucosidase, partial [Bacteroidetes bacterium]|nr:glucosidase [Bacteroidota bacterium]
MSAEHTRLQEDKENKKHWKKWGPYLTDRQWGTVREDYSADGAAWENVTHDHARSKAYRWGEEGIAGLSDHRQIICMAWAFWNGKDPFLKERFFGLTGNQGNHGEDVKEVYFYQDATPTHSYMKMLYKYPHAEFPYQKLVDENKKASKLHDEYELLDTGIFDEDRYFDIVIEYAKQDAEDIVASATIYNRGPEEAKLWVLPTVWFRKFWFTGHEPFMPKMTQVNANCIKAFNPKSGNYFFSFSDHKELVFCDNETNRERLYGIPNERKSTKDAINDYLVSGDASRLLSGTGTKASAVYELSIPSGGEAKVQFRMHRQLEANAPAEIPEILAKRKEEADEFYQALQERVLDKEHRSI